MYVGLVPFVTNFQFLHSLFPQVENVYKRIHPCWQADLFQLWCLFSEVGGWSRPVAVRGREWKEEAVDCSRRADSQTTTRTPPPLQPGPRNQFRSPIRRKQKRKNHVDLDFCDLFWSQAIRHSHNVTEPWSLQVISRTRIWKPPELDEEAAHRRMWGSGKSSRRSLLSGFKPWSSEVQRPYIWLILRCWGKSSMVCQQKSDAL